MEDITKSIGSVLLKLREDKSLSQLKLAATADVDRSFISRIERGTAVPTIAVLQKLCKALDISVSDFVRMCER